MDNENLQDYRVPQITVQIIQNSLRLPIDPDSEDAKLIALYIDSAESYVQQAVNSDKPITEFRKDPKFNEAVALLAEYHYMARGTITNSKVTPPRALDALIEQMQGIYSPYQDN